MKAENEIFYSVMFIVLWIIALSDPGIWEVFYG